MQVVYRSIQMMFLNVPCDSRWNKIVNRQSAREALSNRRRRDIARMRVDEKNARPTVERLILLRWRRRPRLQLANTRHHLVDRDAGPCDDHEVGEIEHARVSVPRRNSCKRVGAQNEEKLRRFPTPIMERTQRVLRI